jgi:hypothetical protein
LQSTPNSFLDLLFSLRRREALEYGRFETCGGAMFPVLPPESEFALAVIPHASLSSFA